MGAGLAAGLGFAPALTVHLVIGSPIEHLAPGYVGTRLSIADDRIDQLRAGAGPRPPYLCARLVLVEVGESGGQRDRGRPLLGVLPAMTRA